ncbi:LuxR C-terminal-related transcriptional regulator [Serratia marcescens]|uniref:LuxR C-terminal-related transcriptional regulator n=1 Tax=Serratia marcescens TaxID=615 RepID=UPI00332C73B0
MQQVNILIDDENAYFAAGLRLSIEEYAQKNHENINLLMRNGCVRPDLVISSSPCRVRRWWKVRGGYNIARIIRIKERKTGHINEDSPVIYRTDNRGHFFTLLDKELAKLLSAELFSGCPLTHREKQVIGYLKKGFDQSQTGRLMGISVKTVHSHKRTVMRKLMINCHHEFIYWLITHEDETGQ